MFGAFANVVRIPELRKRLLITGALLVVYRLGVFIPCPGAYRADVSDMDIGGFLELADMFSGALRMRSILGLGIMPYISASIIFQLMAAVVPALQKIAKEGEVGRKRINQYTRYATVLLCLVQGFMMANWEVVRGPGPGQPGHSADIFGYAHPIAYYFLVMSSLMVGTIFLMWLGEQIDEFGIGSGISLLIMAGILARLPTAAIEIFSNFEPQLGVAEAGKIGPETVITLVLLFFLMVMAVVALTQAHRRVPIHTARTRTREGFSHRSYVPLRLNMSGVISIIFAQALMQVLDLLTERTPLLTWPATRWFFQFLTSGSLLYVSIFAALIVFFSYFYTAVTFNPVEQANNFKEWGTFIPGIRPGHTAEYLDGIMRKVTLVGSVALVYVWAAPRLVTWGLEVSPNVGSFFGGTGLLIVVGVALDLSQRMDQYLLMQHYQGFLDRGKVRGRR